MKNTIKITIPFSFKGEEYTPYAVIDLDNYIQNNDCFGHAFNLVVQKNNINRYSYEYEVLEASPKLFSKPTGIAGDFLLDQSFDLIGFKQLQVEKATMQKLKIIASDVLNIDDLEGHQDIKQALLRAYDKGKELY